MRSNAKIDPTNDRRWFHAISPKTYLWSAVLLIFLGILLFWLRERQDLLSSTDAHTLPRTARVADDISDSALSRTARRKSTGRTLPEGSITTHGPEQLKDFYLLECSGHRVSIQTALKLLDEAYQDACYFSLEKPLKLHYTVEGQSDQLISFSIKGKKWTDALDFIAILAGMEVKRDGLDVRLVPWDVEQKVAQVHLPESIREKMLQQLIDRGDWDAQAEKPDIAALLRLLGLVTDGVIIENADLVGVTIDGTNLEVSAVSAMFRMEIDTPMQLSIRSKLITSPTPLELPLGQLNQEASQVWFRELLQGEGVEINSAPSVTTRSGQKATIEVKQEAGDDWTGMQLDYTAEPIGLKLTASNLTEIRPMDEKLADQRAEAQYLVSDEGSQIKAIGHDAGGYYYQVTSISNAANRGGIRRDDIDAILNNPNRTNTFAEPVAQSVPGKPGFIFSPYTNQIVDVRDILPGTLVADPNFPSAEKKFFRVP